MILMLAFCNTCSDFHMEKAGATNKIIPTEKTLSWLHFDNEPRVQER